MTHPPPRADGKIESTVTSLEMLSPPSGAPRAMPSGFSDGELSIVEIRRPAVHFYRYLYETVGEPWLWIDRRKLDDAGLAAIVQDPLVRIFVLYAGGAPAGYAELDGRVEGEIELAYFGLMPERIGQKLGPWLLDFAIRTAWQARPKRVWVHTCTLDHPGALAMYQRAGFVVFKEEREVSDDARVFKRTV